VHITEPTEEGYQIGVMILANASVKALTLISTKKSMHYKMFCQCLNKPLYRKERASTLYCLESLPI
jgi:hypothetical protein